MERTVFVEMLARATEAKPSAKKFVFREKQRGVVLLASGVESVPVEPVEQIEVEEHYAVISTSRSDTYLVPFERIVALSYKRIDEGGAGFVGS